MAAYMWFRIAEATSRRRLDSCLDSSMQLKSRLDDVEIAEAKRRATEWLRLNSPDVVGNKPEPNATNKPELKRKPFAAAS